MAVDFAKTPMELFEDEFALSVNATVWFNAREYLEQLKRKPQETEEGLRDLNVPPPARTVEEIKEARVRQVGAFAMIEQRLKELGQR